MFNYRGKGSQSPCCPGENDPTENKAFLTKAYQPQSLCPGHPNDTVCNMGEDLVFFLAYPLL